MRMLKNRFQRTAGSLILLALLWLAGVALYQTHKALPDYLDFLGEAYIFDDDDVEFLYDLTYTATDGTRRVEQEVFERVFTIIENARRSILIDMFLFNSLGSGSGAFHRDLSGELTDRLIEKKRSLPSLSIDLITDPINTVYGGSVSPEIDRLRDAGINVMITDLRMLRDSNYLYSAVWRTVIQWFGIFSEDGWLKHPFSPEGTVTLSGYLDLLNFKANHRKVMIADSGDRMVTLVTSANPHAASGLHSNIGFVTHGEIWRSVYETERGVALMSGSKLSPVLHKQFKRRPVAQITRDDTLQESGTVRMRVLTENRIKQAILEACEMAGISDSLKLAQFYMSDRDVVKGLLLAAENGADVKIILDPNKDAFGYEKNGIPNRQVAGELRRKSQNRIKVRWYDTHGEQFHTKLFIMESERVVTVIAGSANLTRRNLDNFNLELSVLAEFEKTSKSAVKINDYFDRIWFNLDGVYSVDFDVYRDNSSFKYALYRIQEKFGLGTF